MRLVVRPGVPADVFEKVREHFPEADIVVSPTGDPSAKREAPSENDTAIYDELHVSLGEATFQGSILPLHRLDLRLLYQLASARGRYVSRDALRATCWLSPPKLRTVDVAICRLRSAFEKRTPLRIATERDLGYRLTDPRRTVANGRRVLIVDDDTAMHNAYRRLLSPLNLRLDLVGTLDRARGKLENASYAACLLDLGLPDGCGSQLIPEVQSRHPYTAVMIVTGRSDDDAIALSGRYGVAYCCKPFNPDWLRNFVRRAADIST